MNNISVQKWDVIFATRSKIILKKQTKTPLEIVKLEKNLQENCFRATVMFILKNRTQKMRKVEK